MKKLKLTLSSLLLLPALWLASSALAAEPEAQPTEEINGAGIAFGGLTIELGELRITGPFGHLESERTQVGDDRMEKGPVRFSINGLDLVMDSVNLDFEDGIIILENVRSRGVEMENDEGMDLQDDLNEVEDDEEMDLEDNGVNGLDEDEEMDLQDNGMNGLEDDMAELQAARMLIDTSTWTMYLVGPYRFQNQRGEAGEVLRLELRVEIETDPDVPEEELERLSPHLGMMDMDYMDEMDEDAMPEEDMDHMDDVDEDVMPEDDTDDMDEDDAEGQ
jgi:hypothetical protein